MNNFKKIGMTALAASLVSTSVFAGEMAVTGSAAINFENYSSSAMSTTKSFSMGNQLTFSGSGELDNGMNVSLSFVIDQGDDENNNETSPFDSHSITVSSDAMGSLTYHGEGGDSAQNAVGDTAAGNIWDNFDGKNGATATLKESNGGTNFIYTLPSMVDGLAVRASYQPAGAKDESDTAYSLVYTGVEGLTLSYGSGSNDADAAGTVDGTAANADTTSMKAAYAIGSFTLAYSDHDHDSNTATSDQSATSLKVSYTVSDALSVTYATDKIDDNATLATSDAEYTKVTAAHTSGGMTVSANYQEADNADYTTGVTSDLEYVGLSVSFAF
jgi:outer membrane protein OmpU